MRLVLHGATGLFAVLSLAACAATPAGGPTILAAPGLGKSFDQFRYDDFRCRHFAAGVEGGVSPQQAASASGLDGVIVGTALGALLGAAAGSAGAGAAFGAGTGLLFGTAIGSGDAARSARSVQAGYDRAYARCMLASGEDVSLP